MNPRDTDVRPQTSYPRIGTGPVRWPSGTQADPATACRACAAALPAPVLSLGRMPLANALLDDPAAPEPTYPLDLAVCPRCSLAQILESVPPGRLFREYPYFSSYSDTMLRHAADLSARMTRERELGPRSLVIEAASNDGYLLRNYRVAGIPVLGIEPARNVARHARDRHGIPTREEFFTAAVGRRLAAEGLRADVFHAHNVLAHVPDPVGFLRGVRAVLAQGGVAVVEVPYAKDMLDHGEFDTIYHEHLCYFTLTAIGRCFERAGLVVTDVERIPIHGGSLRVFAGGGARGRSVQSLLAEEQAWGVDTPYPYREFADRVERIKVELTDLLAGLKAAGHRIAAYGASAKGSTLLNASGIGREMLDFVVDRSPVKQGRYTPGTRLRIGPPGELLEAMPAYTLLLAWNFADEVFAQQAEYRRRGGRFIVPVPTPRLA